MNTRLFRKIGNYMKTVPVERAWIFGSFSRGEEKPESDVDILVEFDKSCRLGLFFSEYFQIWKHCVKEELIWLNHTCLIPR